MKAVWEEEVKLWGIGSVKQVAFKPGVKERELWMSGVVSVRMQDFESC